MDETQKQRLEYLKEKQKQIWHERVVLRQKTEFQECIPDFDKHYVFANAEQIKNVNAFLDKLPALTPTRPDFQNLAKQEMPYANMQNEKSRVFVCFLHGMYVSFDVFCMGELQQVCKDMEFMGIELDNDVNAKVRGEEAIISTPASKVKLVVIPTDEELLIASDTMDMSIARLFIPSASMTTGHFARYKTSSKMPRCR